MTVTTPATTGQREEQPGRTTYRSVFAAGEFRVLFAGMMGGQGVTPAVAGALAGSVGAAAAMAVAGAATVLAALALRGTLTGRIKRSVATL